MKLFIVVVLTILRPVPTAAPRSRDCSGPRCESPIFFVFFYLSEGWQTNNRAVMSNRGDGSAPDRGNQVQ